MMRGIVSGRTRAIAVVVEVPEALEIASQIVDASRDIRKHREHFACGIARLVALRAG